jgi:7-carboxy-7-deazaguanine synthase
LIILPKTCSKKALKPLLKHQALTPFRVTGTGSAYRLKSLKRQPNMVADKAHELKVIVFNKSDFAFAEHHAKLVGPNCKLYLQPEWSKHAEMTPLIVDYVMANPQWEISLQTHKYLNIP